MLMSTDDNGVKSTLYKIVNTTKKCYLQFLMSEMNTANPRIPSPFDTAGIFADFCPHSGLKMN